MKVLCLFNKVMGSAIQEIEKGNGHDSWLFGMLRLRKFGIDTDSLEIEKYIPRKFAGFLRRYILTMHYAHIPLFPFFFRYDVVFTSTAYGSLVLKALFNIKSFKWVILDFNLLGTLQKRTTVKQKIFDWAVRKGADGIVAISQAEADALKLHFPNLKDRIIFLHETTDTKFFAPMNIKESNQIVTVGNYGRDFDTVIKAIEEIDVNLLIVGKFSKEKAAKLPPYVKSTQLTQNEIVRAYAESKIVVVSLCTDDSYFDSVGTLSLGEAMSMGKATIVTHTKSMKSYIYDGINGIFVKKEDVTEMRNAIVYLLKNDTKRRDMGQKAREFALQKLDPDTFAKHLAIFLKSVI
ncbi:MAG: glycosyltransferase family 4 protein [Patescibacteria group bacterium]